MRLALTIGAVMASFLWVAAPANAEKPQKEYGYVDEQGQPVKPFAERSLDEEKALLKQRLEKLDKMTPSEWEAHKKERIAKREAWKKMTPEERKAAKEKWQAKRAEAEAKPKQ